MENRVSDRPQGNKQPPHLLAGWRWWLAPAVLSLLLILLFVDPFIGDWDALDYTINAIHGVPSSMALGRCLFIFFNHALYLIGHAAFGLSAQNAYLVFKYAVVAQGPLTVIACWLLTHDLTQSRYAATIAAVLVTFSPVFILYSGQVMTDVPALLLLTLALIVHLRGLKQDRVWLVLAGAALLGAGVNLRETTAFFGLWLVLAPFAFGRRPSPRLWLLIVASVVVFVLCAGSWFAYWFLSDAAYRAAWYGWRETMLIEAARHRFAVSNLWPWFAFFLVNSPLVLLTLPFAAVREWRRRDVGAPVSSSKFVSPVFLLAVLGLLANVLLLLSYATTIGWRYLLTGLPALVPLTAGYLTVSLTKRTGSARRSLIVTSMVVAMLAVSTAIALRRYQSNQLALRAAAKEYDRTLVRLPRNAVMLSGLQTVAVNYWRGVGAGEWDVIGTGAGWPGERLAPLVDDYLRQGRRVFIDQDPRWWGICSWQREEIPEIVKLQSRFHFRQMFATIYELRPSGDQTAHDDAHLERLLPENRQEELRNCPPTRR